MEIRKIGDIVTDVVKKLNIREEYREVAVRFLKNECRITPEGITMHQKGTTLFLYTQDPQRFYRVHIYKQRLLEYLKEQLPACAIEEIVVRIKDDDRP